MYIYLCTLANHLLEASLATSCWASRRYVRSTWAVQLVPEAVELLLGRGDAAGRLPSHRVKKEFCGNTREQRG